MNSEIILAIVLACIGSSGLSALIQFIINRKDIKAKEALKIDEKLEELSKGIKKTEKDNVRTQLLILMMDKDKDEYEILKCAEHYFKDLDGNWFMTSKFVRYCEQNNINIPTWVNTNNIDKKS